MNFKRYTPDLEITDYKFGARPDVTIPDREFYKVLGEEGIRKLVTRHYELLRVSEISHLFPKDDELFEIGMNKIHFLIVFINVPNMKIQANKVNSIFLF